MDDCKNCEYLEQCRNGKKVKCPQECFEEIYNPIIIKMLEVYLNEKQN